MNQRVDKRKKIRKAVQFIIFVVICELAGIIGSVFTVSSVTTWYSTLIKSTFTPPSWVFGPVWTILYTLMGTAAFVIWQKGLQRKDVKIALSLFLFQLILNTSWSILFFGLQAPGLAFLEIIFLWLTIIATIVAFARISKPAAWLLVPYLLWVSFATFLNYAIWQLN